MSGGGGLATDWHPYQIPFFEGDFRNTTFDNRGIGATECDLALPWPLESFARDTAEVIEAVCEPPVAIVGLSLGGAIVQQVAIDYPDLLRCCITMGTGARSTGWGWDYQKAEIDWRKEGDRLDGMMAVVHNAAMMYPARVLGDRELWPKLRGRPRVVALHRRQREVADPAVGGVPAATTRRRACPAARCRCT